MAVRFSAVRGVFVRAFGLFYLAQLLGGCVLLRPQAPPTPPLLSPAALGAAHVASQSLNIAFGTDDLSLQCALQASAEGITLIAVGPLGQRALTLNYDGNVLRADKGPYVPAAFPPEQVLSDLQLVLWPNAAWQQRLAGSEWQMAEPRPGLRRLRYRGRLVAEVHYADAATGDPWNRRAWLSNLAYGYTLDISTLSQ